MVRHSRGKYASSIADFNEALLLDPNDKHAKKLREHSAAKEREVLLKTCSLSTQPFLGSWSTGRYVRNLVVAQPFVATGANQHRTMCSVVGLEPMED